MADSSQYCSGELIGKTMDVSGAQAQNILDLPERLEVKVQDVISLDEAGRASEGTSTAKTGAGILLVAKICHALLNWSGYGADDVRKVASLVARNLITCESSYVKIEPEVSIDEHNSSEGTGIDVPGKVVASMLKGLLDPTISHPRHVHINSNEPVLLVHFGRPLLPKERDRVNDVIDTIVEQLQQQWNIWPVRVYGHAGAYTSQDLNATGAADSHGDLRRGGFSITLLNVVNTDIGGPSMPQLLDAACDAPEWKTYLRREVWRGRDLEMRQEGEGNWDRQEDAAAYDDNASERSFRSENEDDDTRSVGSDAANFVTSGSPRGPESLVREEAADEHQDVALEGAAHGGSQNSAQLEDSVESAIHDDNNDRDAARATIQSEPPSQDFEAPERHIKHPTWERHDDSTSLIDLIRSQAELIAPFGTEDAGHGVGDIEGEVAKSRPEGVESPSTGDDEFIVV